MKQWRTNRNSPGEGEICHDSLQSKLARTRTEVLPIGQRSKDGASGVNTLKGDVVAAPVDLKLLLLQGEEGDQGADSDGAGEGGRSDAERMLINFPIKCSGYHSLVVLGPPAQVAPLDVVVKEKADGDSGPDIGQVVGSPEKSTNQENRNVDVAENPVLLAEEVEGDGQNSADGETPQKAIVDGTRTEHLPGTESTPKDGSGEESVISRASKMTLLRR